MAKQKLVLVGNGMAGMKCIEQIYELSPDAFEITVLGSEPHPNYNRILLSKVLQGDTSIDDITINSWSWYKERNIRLFAGETVIRVNKELCHVETASGLTIDYDHLILATGSAAFMPRLPGIDKPGVTGFRNMEDCRMMLKASETYHKAAVIGGGLLGLEAARGLLNLGMDVDVVHNAPYLMNRQLDRMAADMLKKQLTDQGMRFWMEKRTEEITGRKRAQGLRFSDGTKLAADLIVLAIGISPNSSIATSSGIRTNRAILVNDYMETNVPNIYAIGECAEHRDTVYGLVAPLYEQGKVLASRLCGQTSVPYKGSIPYAQLKVSGVEVFSAGIISDVEADTAFQQYDGLKGTYKKVMMKHGKIAGAVLFGDSAEGTLFVGYLQKGASVSVLQDHKSSSGINDGSALVANLADEETVCSCNGVSKAVIVGAVHEGGALTVERVCELTRASGSCGGCKPLVSALVEYALSGREVKAYVAPICGCTELDHAALKDALRNTSYANETEVRTQLCWNTTDGCPICRVALRYYLSLCSASHIEPKEDIKNSKMPVATVHVGPIRKMEGSVSRDNKGMGIDMDTMLRNQWMPYPIQVALSSGPMYPAGTLVSDFGIAGSPAGWEIYAGGHSENPVRQAHLISVETADHSAIEIVISCIQWYRNSAHYGEPAWKWVERLGLQRLRETLLDPDAREEVLHSWKLEGSLMILDLYTERTVS